MKNLLKLEELALCILFIWLSQINPLCPGIWYYILLFLSPDIGMIGYIVNARIGAITYNLTHHKGIAAACWIVGMILNSDVLVFAGLILLAHSSFDRMLGYGLKLNTGFHDTHLGKIGKVKTE